MTVAGLQVVVFGFRLIQPVISTLTMVKVTLLVVMVGIVGYAGSQVTLDSTHEWSDLMQPFLIGTLALGGVINLFVERRGRLAAPLTRDS